MIATFSGVYAFLSNFWREEGLADRLWGYPTMEHYFQAMKTMDLVAREPFKNPDVTPGRSKRMGRNLVLRPNWEDMKDDVMRVGLERKFAHGTALAERLLDTGDQKLVEGNNWHDNYWGDCSCNNCRDIEGRNMLGKLLMGQRYDLITGGDPNP